MYEPYAHGDTRKLQELYLGLEHMMTRVAWIMLLGVAVVTIIYPLILAENALPQWELLVLIALGGIKFVLPYFFTVAKKQILNVVEKSYLITSIDRYNYHFHCALYITEFFVDGNSICSDADTLHCDIYNYCKPVQEAISLSATCRAILRGLQHDKRYHGTENCISSRQ